MTEDTTVPSPDYMTKNTTIPISLETEILANT